MMEKRFLDQLVGFLGQFSKEMQQLAAQAMSRFAKHAAWGYVILPLTLF